MEDVYYKKFAALPDSYTTFYSLKLKTPEGPLREIDFLVFSPDGIFVIELKNGMYLRKGENLSLQNHDGEEFEIDGRIKRRPEDQAVTAGYRLIELFLSGGVSVKNSEISNLLFFLKDGNEKAFAEKFSGGYSIFHDELGSASLEEILSTRKPENISESDGKKLIGIILDRTNYVRGFAHRKKLQSEQAIALTKHQYEAMLFAHRSPRSLISGVAGSGKTLVLLELARRASLEKKEILFLCHNSSLNAAIHEELSGYANITVHRMVGFALEIIRHTEPDFGKRSDDDVRKELDKEGREGETSKYLKETLPLKALEHLDAYLSDYRNGKKFDLLIVDEAQDILTETELLLLDSLTTGGLTEGNWMIAYDGDQSLNGDIEKGLAWLKKILPEEHFLPVNIRTPESVYRMACRLTGLGGESTLRNVMEPIIVYYENEKEAQDGLLRILEHASKDLKYSPEEILILGPVTKKNTAAPGSKLKIGGWEIRLVKEGKTAPGFVGYSEIKKFKGLEAPYVILTGLEKLNPVTERNLLYVAMTRTTGVMALLLPEKMQTWMERELGNSDK